MVDLATVCKQHCTQYQCAGNGHYDTPTTVVFVAGFPSVRFHAASQRVELLAASTLTP
tara:strand:- start:167 stop:340 length:174 start_codon:yes stop_codon:yes gene_type:complete